MDFLKKRPYILFILPALLLYTLLTVYPIVMSIPYSLMKWSGVGAKEFVGLQNFIMIFSHEKLSAEFVNALKNNIYGLGINYLIVNPIVIILAYLLYKKIPGYAVFRTVIFMPYFINTIALSFMVTLFFSPTIGLYSNVMHLIGLDQYSIFPLWEDPKYGVPLLAMIWAWRGIGYEMLLYIANFNMVPAELEEAAKIDGAGELKRFTHIYLPLIMPAITNVIVLMYIWTIMTFDIPYVVGGMSGGIDGNMDFLALFFYRTAFGKGSYSANFLGIGTAISTVILAILALGSFLLMSLLRKRQVEY